jgi:NTE family protein
MDARGGARRGARRNEKPRIGLALAGGGPVGGVYEIGALCALQDGLEGIDLADLDIYVGVSSGAFIAATLANHFSPAELREIFIENDSREHPVTPDVFLAPALGEFWRRALSFPGLIVDGLRDYARSPFRNPLAETLFGIGRAIPTGLFDNEHLGRFLGGMFQGHGRSNDFRELSHRLILVATDLDTCESVEFGAPGLDRVPISKAVQASSALPGLYPPVRIGGRYYVDGALRKTLHASVALREGADLVLCVNPLIPFDASLAAIRGEPKHENLVKGGLPVVLSQTFRSLIYSRMQVGMSTYEKQYKDAHVVLFQPDRDDAEMFFTNVFSYANRRRVFQHGYEGTLSDLATRRRELEPILNRHGISIRSGLGANTAAQAPKSVASALEQLAGTLDLLQQWVEAGRVVKAVE